MQRKPLIVIIVDFITRMVLSKIHPFWGGCNGRLSKKATVKNKKICCKIMCLQLVTELWRTKIIGSEAFYLNFIAKLRPWYITCSNAVIIICWCIRYLFDILSSNAYFPSCNLCSLNLSYSLSEKFHGRGIKV